MSKRNIRKMILKNTITCIGFAFITSFNANALISGLSGGSSGNTFCSDLIFANRAIGDWKVDDTGNNFVYAAAGSEVLLTRQVNSACNSLAAVGQTLEIQEETIRNVVPLAKITNKSASDNKCDVTYHMPLKEEGVDEGIAVNGTSILLNPVGKLRFPDANSVNSNTCSYKSCDALTVEEIRAIYYHEKKSNEEKFEEFFKSYNGTGTIITPKYVKYCEPKKCTAYNNRVCTNATPDNAKDLYCHDMQNPNLFKWLYVSGKSATEAKLDKDGKQVYHCKLHQCKRNDAISTFCPTNFDIFYNYTNMNLAVTDSFGISMSYDKLYERDILLNNNFNAISQKELYCSPAPSNDENCKIPRIIEIKELSCGTKDTCSTLMNNSNTCDKYTGMDNSITSSTDFDSIKQSFSLQGAAFVAAYDKCINDNVCENGDSVCINVRNENCISDKKTCVFTTDCGLSIKKNVEPCLSAIAQISEPNSVSAFFSPLPHPRAIELVCEIDGKSIENCSVNDSNVITCTVTNAVGVKNKYGAYYTNNDESDQVSSALTLEYKKCIEVGGKHKTILKRSLFGQLDSPLPPTTKVWDKVAAWAIIAASLGTATSSCMPEDNFTGNYETYTHRLNGNRANFYSNAKDGYNPESQMFCGSEEDFQKRYEAYESRRYLCDDYQSVLSNNYSKHYDSGWSATYVSGTRRTAPMMVGICSPLSTDNAPTASGSTYTCGNGKNYCNFFDWDSYYIKEEPEITWSTEKPIVTNANVKACMRFQSLADWSLCGTRTTRVDCGIGLCEFQYRGKDRCSDLSLNVLENSNGCVLGHVGGSCVQNVSNSGGTHKFRFRLVRGENSRLYVFLDRTTSTCVGRNTTYLVQSSSEIDNLRDIEDIYGTCIVTGGIEVNPHFNNKFERTQIYCRDRLTERTQMNLCADSENNANGTGCEGDVNTNQKRTFNMSDFYSNNPIGVILGDCKSSSEMNVFGDGNEGKVAQRKTCKVLLYKRSPDESNENFSDLHEQKNLFGKNFKGRLTALSLYDDNSLSDNNCDGKITDEDVFGEYLFKNLNCGYMFGNDYKILPQNDGENGMGGNVVYSFVEPEDWCKKKTEYVKDENSTPFDERFGATEKDYPDGNGRNHSFLINRKCSNLLMHKSVDVDPILNPEENHKASEWLPIDVVQYAGNNQLQGNIMENSQCTINSVENCRGYYNEKYYESGGVDSFVKESQGIPLPLPVSPSVYWRYAIKENMPDLFLPIIQISQYKKTGTNNYYNFVVGGKNQYVDFFEPSIKLVFGISDAYASILFNKSDVTGNISTIYVAGSSSENISVGYKFKKFGQIYPQSKGLACLVQLSTDGSEQQIGCLDRGTPNINNFILVRDTDGYVQTRPWVRAFFHNGNNLSVTGNVVGGLRAYFLKNNLSMSDTAALKQLIFTNYSRVDNTTYSDCSSLPTIKNEYAYLNTIDNPQKTCKELEEKIKAGMGEYTHLNGENYAYESGYPIYISSSYCSKVHYDCVNFTKEEQVENAKSPRDENYLSILNAKIRNCESQIETYCKKTSGNERTIQLDENKTNGTLTRIKENYLLNTSANEMCVTTGFERYFKGGVNASSVKAVKLQYYYPELEGIGKCILTNESKGNPACRISDYYTYCEYKEGIEDSTCNPLVDVAPTQDDMEDLGVSSLPNTYFCRLSVKNCVKRVSCDCNENGNGGISRCIDLPEQCFKGGSNLYKTLYKGALKDVTEDIAREPSCNCQLVSEDALDGVVVNSNQELRNPTPREFGLCAPLQDLDFCEPVKYYNEDRIYLDGNAGQPLSWLKNNSPGNLWRTNQKVEGRYYSVDDLGHAEFSKSNVCKEDIGNGNVSDEDWNKNFCLNGEYSYHEITGAECIKGTDKCITSILHSGSCGGFWKNKIYGEEGDEDARKVIPLATCTYFKTCAPGDKGCSITGKMPCAKDNEGCSPYPVFLMMDNTQCERYTCPDVRENEVFIEDEDEIADYSESEELKDMTADRRGQKHGYATWIKYKKGTDLYDCENGGNCAFEINEARNSVATTKVGEDGIADEELEANNSTTKYSNVRTGVENGKGDDLEERYANACVQGFAPAGSNLFLREFNAANAFVGINDKFSLDTSKPVNMIPYMVEQDKFMRSALGYDVGYYFYSRDKTKNDSKIINYNNFVALTGWSALEHLPIRSCNQVGEWMSPYDIYNIHGVAGYYRKSGIFENGVIAETCVGDFKTCKSACLETKERITDATPDICANACMEPFSNCIANACQSNYTTCTNSCDAITSSNEESEDEDGEDEEDEEDGDTQTSASSNQSCQDQCMVAKNSCTNTSLSANLNLQNLDKFPQYLGNYCERLYCPGYDDGDVGLLSIEKCDPTNTNINNKNKDNCSMLSDDKIEFTIPSSQSSGNETVRYSLYYSNEKNYDNYPLGLYEAVNLLSFPASNQPENYIDLGPSDPGAQNTNVLFEEYRNNGYKTPKIPLEFDTRINNVMNNKNTIWRHTGGAIWAETPTPRNNDVISYQIQGKCIEERKFYAENTLFFAGFEPQFNNVMQNLGVSTDNVYTEYGVNHTNVSKFLSSMKTTPKGNYIITNPEISSFFKDPMSANTQPTRSCGKWGQWSAIKNGCLSVCEALDPFRTTFKDTNKNGFLENWEITEIFSKPRYNSIENWWRNGLWAEIRQEEGWIEKSDGTICKESSTCTCDKGGDGSCDDITFYRGWGDYVTKMQMVTRSGYIQKWSGEICEKGKPNCTCDIGKLRNNGSVACQMGDIVYNNDSCDVDPGNDCSNIAGNTWSRINGDDMILNNNIRTYNGNRYGDRYTGGAKWGRSLGGLTITNIIIRDGRNETYVADEDDKIYIKGTCFSLVGKKIVENSKWVEGFPTDGALFVQSGDKNNVFEGAPHRECLADGTWGPVIDPCINFTTCVDFKITSKNMLQYMIDTEPQNNTPLTMDAKNRVNIDVKGVISHTQFDFQLKSDETEDVKTIGTLEGGKLNYSDILTAQRTNVPTLPVEINCSQASSSFVDTIGYNTSNIATINVNNNSVNTPSTNEIAAAKTITPKIGRLCNVATGDWEPGYNKFECRMKSCGDIAYSVGTGDDRIVIVDYKAIATNDNIGISGTTNPRSIGKVINKIEGLFYPKNSGYTGSVEFGNFADPNKQVFKNYEFKAQCPEGYKYCELHSTNGNIICNGDSGVPQDMETQITFTCELEQDSPSAQAIWKRKGECVAQYCIWQNDFGSGTYTSNAIGTSLPWKQKQMIMPYAKDNTTYVGGLNAVGGLPALNSRYMPVSSDTSIADRDVKKNSKTYTQPQYNYSYNISNKKTSAVVTTPNVNVKQNLRALLTRKTILENNSSGLPFESLGIYSPSVTIYKNFMANVNKKYIFSQSAKKYSTAVSTVSIENDTTTDSKTLLNYITGVEANIDFFIGDSFTSTINDPISKTALEDLEKLGKVTVGTEIRMDAYCVRKVGRYYPKDNKIIAKCNPPTSGGLVGRWEVNTDTNAKCKKVCDLSKLPFDHTGIWWRRQVTDNIATATMGGSGQKIGNSVNYPGIVPVFVKDKVSANIKDYRKDLTDKAISASKPNIADCTSADCVTARKKLENFVFNNITLKVTSKSIYNEDREPVVNDGFQTGAYGTKSRYVESGGVVIGYCDDTRMLTGDNVEFTCSEMSDGSMKWTTEKPADCKTYSKTSLEGIPANISLWLRVTGDDDGSQDDARVDISDRYSATTNIFYVNSNHDKLLVGDVKYGASNLATTDATNYGSTGSSSFGTYSRLGVQKACKISVVAAGASGLCKTDALTANRYRATALNSDHYDAVYTNSSNSTKLASFLNSTTAAPFTKGEGLLYTQFTNRDNGSSGYGFGGFFEVNPVYTDTTAYNMYTCDASEIEYGGDLVDVFLNGNDRFSGKRSAKWFTANSVVIAKCGGKTENDMKNEGWGVLFKCNANGTWTRTNNCAKDNLYYCDNESDNVSHESAKNYSGVCYDGNRSETLNFRSPAKERVYIGFPKIIGNCGRWNRDAGACNKPVSACLVAKITCDISEGYKKKIEKINGNGWASTGVGGIYYWQDCSKVADDYTCKYSQQDNYGTWVDSIPEGIF
ncbi:MAG: hypothetical protein LBT02_00430 [Rickettsiales bacterium]|jgi:hypothetical protein|nr:hypothetical protein [Rickettsiales bacterium]